MSNNYHIGYIFDPSNIEEYSQVAQWCNENQATIELRETEAEIVEIPEPSEEQKKQWQREKLLQFLSDTDNYAIRLATGEAQGTDYSETYNCTFNDIMLKRKQTREELKQL